MATVFAFIDTNTFLHYRPVDQIDWLSELRAKQVTIIVASSVLNELDAQKWKHPLGKIRARAAAAVKKLSGYADSDLPYPLRNGVKLDISPDEPSPDYAELHLNKESGDDHLIASIIEFRAREPNGETLLVTADVGLKLKARRHGVQVRTLRDDLRLPDEADASEKRIKELETRLREYESAAPALQLSFQGGCQRASFRIPARQRSAQEYVEKEMAHLRAELPHLVSKLNPHSDLTVELALGFQLQEVKAYNEGLDQYYARYAEYLREFNDFENERLRTIELSIVLENTGSWPAEDVDILMQFPDGFVLLEKKYLRQPPKKPQPPPYPQSLLEKMSNMFSTLDAASIIGPFMTSPRLHNLRDLPPKNVSPPSIKRSHSFEVTCHVQKLKHKFTAPLHPLYVVFDSLEAISSFAIDYGILASNSPKEFPGRLDVIVERVE
jgi:rRNA-processing protein FCF1